MVVGPAEPRGLRPLVGWMLAALAVQFLLGMFSNLFVQVPASHRGVDASYFAGVLQGVFWALGNAATVLRLHVELGVLLFLCGIVILVWAIRSRRRPWIWTAAVGRSASSPPRAMAPASSSTTSTSARF